MSENFISSLHIQKLGHKLEEIRIRALNHVLSKLDHGINAKNDMSRCLELLKKLFEWFDFDKLSEEEKVLNLIFRILKSEIGVSIVKHVGTVALIRDLKQIRTKVKERQYFLVDRIIQTVESVYDNPNSMPLLISDPPLSYRSGQTVYDQVSQHSRPCTANVGASDRLTHSIISPTSCTYRNNQTPRDNHSFRTNVTGISSDRIGTAATTISGLEYKSTTASGIDTGVPRNGSSTGNSVSPVDDVLYKSVAHITMNWQPLVKSDCHVLKSVEESLQNPPQPSVLMHSCQFFCNVMLQDFPAEVFLQRPSILSLFYDMINTCPSTRITNAALVCLNKLTENLIIRIKFYSDPCTYNLKQGTSLMNDPENCNGSPHRMFDYNIDISKQIVTAESDSDDNELFRCSQISVPQYCIKTCMCILNYVSEKPQSFRDGQNRKKTQSGVNTALQVMDKLVTLTTLCIKSSIWDNQRDGTLVEIIRQLQCLLEKLGDVLEQFRLMVVASDMEYFERMAQLHLLHSTSYLLTELVPISKADAILPRTLKNSLSSSLLDASFGRLYPAAHESLVQYVNVFTGHYETESLTKYKDVQQVCKAMTKAVKILKHTSTCHIESLQLIFDSLPSLEFHKNLSIINTFLKICVKHNSFFNSDEVTHKLVGDILLAFLSHSDEDIQKEMYALCQKLIVNILGINHTKHISETDPGSQVVFLFRSDVFVELAAHGLASNSVQIQTYAEDILIHILKCKFLVSESVWRRMIRSIIPAMPILQCYMNSSTPLGKAIVKMMDPDISPSLFMSTIDVLKGNLRMLFSTDIKLRNEAVSRLCWLLTTEQDANEKVPKIKSLQDCGLSNIFQFEYPIDLGRMKSANQFYQVSSLQQVLELLASRSVEPAIRRSALTQVSVMLDDHFLHPAFLEQNGLKLVLNILQNSLNVHQYHNYPDSVIPAISILKNICLYNAVIRQELAHNIDFIFNLLRALFLYCTDKRMQQDGALLCCLLLFSEFAIYSYAGKDIVSFSLPEVIVQQLHMPFKCHTHWKTSRHTKPSLLGLLMTDDWCRSTLRMHWNIEWFGGISELITWSQVPAISALSPQQLAEFSADLRLTREDLLALKASSVVHCCQKYLFDIENATTHLSVLESVRGIAGYIGLWLLAYKSKMYTPDETLLSLSWNSAFSRFLSAPPANNEDQNLLVEILKCLTVMLKLYKNSGKPCWIANILQDPAHYLPKLLQVDVKSEHQSVSLELLTLVAACSTLEQHLLDIGLVSGSTYQQKENKLKPRNKNWIHVVQIITDNLKFSDTEQFYNLAYLNKLLACLVEITSNLGWSEVNSHATDFHKLFSELVAALSELLTSFHYGKGAEAASSFMGMSISRNALLTMNHILTEMQHSFKKNWDTYWVSDTICSASLFSLYSLWSCRDVVVRAATLQLLSGLATSPRGATIIVETVRQKYGGVWEAALMILIDHSEASIVREHAALLLTNLCSHANVSGSQATLPLCHSPLSANKDMSPIDTVLMLLKEYNFFEELDALLACLYLESTFQPNRISSSKMKTPIASVITTARSYVVTSTESASSHTSEGGVNIFVTPSLVKAVASFVSNLLFFAPEQVSALMEQHALVRSFFRCLSCPSLDITDSRHLLLYADILEMCGYVCALLTRTVLVSVPCRTMALHTRDCLHVLISLLNPSLYDIHLPHFLYLRNQLWCEIFRFLTALLDAQLDRGSKDCLDAAKDSYKILSPLLAECGYEPFIRSIYESIESETAGLQKSALQALTSLLTVEALSFISRTDHINTFSLQHLLDEIKTPRDIYAEDIENLDPNVEQVSDKRSSLEAVQDKTTRSVLDSYRNTLMTQETSIQKTAFTKKFKQLPVRRGEKLSLLSRTDVNLMVGADLCNVLLRLYEMSNLEKNKDNKRRAVIIGALSSLLNTSDEAKKCALDEGLLAAVMTHLKNLHVEVSLHSADSLRKISDKKKVCPILKEVDGLFGLLTNFVKGNERAKETAAELGLADVTHKYWLWCCLERNMLVDALKMLCTFTSKCDHACQSLTLTNPAPGSGPRKVPTSVSLLNVIINLVAKEMELVSRSHDITVLQLSFQVLQHVCSVLECRIILAKSNLFQSLNRLHPALTKRQRPWETMEHLWLEFLETFTFYPEGQLHVTKTNDVLELILSLASGPKATNKLAALAVLRNVAFHQSNRIKLLASVEFIQLLHTKLTNGTLDEKNTVVSIIWALVANSQRSKMVIKCAGLDARIQDLIKQYEMKGIHDKTYQTMLYVFAVLKDGDK